MPKALPRALSPGVAGETAGVTQSLRDPESYKGRSGYIEDFVGGVAVPLPDFPGGREDVAIVTCPDRPGELVYDLRYEHFSVVTCKSRRMPFYSCVNLDGTQEQTGLANPAWRRDPRIEVQYQLLTDGIYGNKSDGLFSRGHMTRREDPNWGTVEEAELANADTFHVANACPQVQNFNAPIWLALEEYIKKNAWNDDMHVSVMTGPIFSDLDPIYRPKNLPEIQVPTEFWKIVIFQHDDSGDVVATAYKASQAAQLPAKNRVKPQFVFGAFNEYQMKISDLELETGLDFGPLRGMDVLGDLSDGVTIQHASLSDVIFVP